MKNLGFPSQCFPARVEQIFLKKSAFLRYLLNSCLPWGGGGLLGGTKVLAMLPAITKQ